jgi:hypothetical protein
VEAESHAACGPHGLSRGGDPLHIDSIDMKTHLALTQLTVSLNLCRPMMVIRKYKKPMTSIEKKQGTKSFMMPFMGEIIMTDTNGSNIEQINSVNFLYLAYNNRSTLPQLSIRGVIKSFKYLSKFKYCSSSKSFYVMN